MFRKTCAWLLCVGALCAAAVPTPREYLGFTPGDDYKLADTAQIFGYFQKLASASRRIRLVEFGRSALGKPMYVAFISAPENLNKLDRYRDISRRLALGLTGPEEAQQLAGEGKAVVWIDSGLHASEVAPAQHAPVLAYRMLAGESPELEAIRSNVILMQVPVINPDGLDWIAHWYEQNVGTPYETAPLPWLYQKYAGHDNNRDWFMLNLQETRHVTRVLFREWFPQILYNQHQSPPFPARIFIPPYAEPLNPHIPAAVMEGINLIGMAIKERFALENQPGVLSYHGFDAWWNGGLRSVPAFHNMHGILTETAGNLYATPRVYQPSEIHASFANGMPTREPTIFYERPWLGGKWSVRDAIEYMLTADFAILDLASRRRSDLLFKGYQMARAAIAAGEKGKPYAYVIAPDQWDPPTAMEMLDRLALAGIEVRRARAPFRANGRSYPEGAYVLPAAQPFRPYLMDLLEPQKYPELRSASGGQVKTPYDIAGWTLSLQMGVAVDRVDDRFDAELDPVAPSSKPEEVRPKLDHRENASFSSTAVLLSRGEKVSWAADGTIIAGNESGPAKPAYELRRPRVAIYQPWIANADEGWTEWLLDRYRIPYTLLHNEDFHKNGLLSRFDTVILAAQTAASILHGTRHGEVAPAREGEQMQVTVQRPDYVGGIGAQGLAHLQNFVRQGGTLVALDTATELPIQFFPLPVRNLVRPTSPDSPPGSNQFYCPGSLVRIDVDPTNPLAFGMQNEAIAFSTGGEAFEINVAPRFNQGDHEVRSVARYATHDLLASGWVSGEKTVLGKHVLLEARYGRGQVVLFGFRPQFRGQSFGTFKFLLNAIYLASAQRL